MHPSTTAVQPDRQACRSQRPDGMAGSSILLYSTVEFHTFRRLGRSLSVRGAKVWVDFAFIRNVPKSILKKRRNSVSVVPVGGVCCTRLPTLLPLLPLSSVSPCFR